MIKLSMKTAWKLGLAAARSGEGLEANPFQLQSELSQSWIDGWGTDIASKASEKP